MTRQATYMKAVLVNLPEVWILKLDEGARRGLWANRNEAIREAVRDYLKLRGLWG